jgi:uncharacterized membrane protein
MMTKNVFLQQLKNELSHLPKAEIDRSLAYYAEAIDDRMEEGMTEEAAVADLGDIAEIASQIIAETPVIPKAIAKANTGSRTLNIVLLVVLSPIWVPIALALASVVFSIYIAIWSVIVALWSAVFALVISGIVGILMCAYNCAMGNALTGLFILGCGLVGSGLGLFAFFGVLAASKGLIKLTQLFAHQIRSLFVHDGTKKEEEVA